MQKDELTALQDALAKMTLPGKWQLSGVREKQAPQLGKDARFLKIGPDSDYVALVFFDMNTGLGHRDAAGIVALVNAAPALITSAARAAELEAEVARLREALIDAGDVLAQAAKPARVDSNQQFSRQVKALGDAFGYGALMTTASALWREALGDLAGAEFAAGPCVSTAASRVARIDAALGEQQ